MYLLSNCTDARGYFPINTKWGGTSTLSGLLPGGGLRAYFPTSRKPIDVWEKGSQGHNPGSDRAARAASPGATPGGMRYYRPNFAMARGNYPGGGLGQQTKDESVMADKWFLNGLGDVAVDPTTLAIGIGALALGMFLFGGKVGPKLRQRKAGRLRKRRAAIDSRLRELEA